MYVNFENISILAIGSLAFEFSHIWWAFLTKHVHTWLMVPHIILSDARSKSLCLMYHNYPTISHNPLLGSYRINWNVKLCSLPQWGIGHFWDYIYSYYKALSLGVALIDEAPPWGEGPGNARLFQDYLSGCSWQAIVFISFKLSHSCDFPIDASQRFFLWNFLRMKILCMISWWSKPRNYMPQKFVHKSFTEN